MHPANRMFTRFQETNPSKKLNLKFMTEDPEQISFAIKLKSLQKVEKIYEMTKEQQD